MTAPYSLDDTATLLALDLTDTGGRTVDDQLADISRTFITWVALQAKTDAYDLRLTRSLQAGAAAGIPARDLADSAGITTTELDRRLTRTPITDNRGTTQRPQTTLQFTPLLAAIFNLIRHPLADSQRRKGNRR